VKFVPAGQIGDPVALLKRHETDRTSWYVQRIHIIVIVIVILVTTAIRSSVLRFVVVLTMIFFVVTVFGVGSDMERDEFDFFFVIVIVIVSSTLRHGDALEKRVWEGSDGCGCVVGGSRRDGSSRALQLSIYRVGAVVVIAHALIGGSS